MNRDDFVKLVGTGPDTTQYLPVAFLLRNGYACAGYYTPSVNEGLLSTCVLLNARLIELQGEKLGGRACINDFNDFLEEVVVDFCDTSRRSDMPARSDAYGKSIPLTAIPYDQIAVVYPVAHISALMRRAGQQKQQQEERPPSSFLDLNKSEILNLLRTKLW
jgi:hypothetical protein